MSAKNDYLKADYEAAAAHKNDVKTIAYKIGGLVFTGQHPEARLLYKSFKDQLDEEAFVVANFHMGLSYTRTSDYEKGRQHFVENLRFVRGRKISHEAHFFAYQGVSFYRFFFSKHQKSQRLAEKGYGHLLQMSEAPGLLMVLSLDIQAHNKIQLGHINQGFKLFEEALKVTKKSGLRDLQSEMEISFFTYRSDFDPDLENHIHFLESFLEQSENKNDYSKSEIVLQIAKLKLLGGHFQGANEFLNSHFDVIYKNQNKRKIAKLNTLMAQLILYRGQYLEALSILNVALTHLDSKIDRSLYLPLLGLKMRVLRYLDRDYSEEWEESERMLARIDRSINKSIQSRWAEMPQDREIGDDKMGDLFDRAFKKLPGSLEDILKFKVYSLLHVLFDLRPDRKYILICQNMNRVLLIDPNQIFDTEKGLSKLQVQILNEIRKQACSKQDLVEKVWGYEYDPLRHDSLVYTAVGRLRKILEPHGQWIYADENHYSLDQQVEILQDEPLINVHRKEKKSELKKVVFQDLNYRQLQMISEGEAVPLSVSEYGEKWEVTRMTALRDLGELVEKGLASKVGRGKATRYLLNVSV